MTQNFRRKLRQSSEFWPLTTIEIVAKPKTEMNILEEQKNPVMCRESRPSARLPLHFVKL